MDQNYCQVCFVQTLNSLPHNQLIKCLYCSRKAHRYCYQPSQVGISFICDLCQKPQNRGRMYKERCYLCDNDGLLKYAGNTKRFGHVICLLMSPFTFVSNYQKLQFICFEDQRKTPKKCKCQLCGKVTSNIIKCFSKGCTKYAHFYCCMKYFQGQDNNWKFTLNISFRKKLYQNYYESQMKRYIKQKHPFLQRKLKININRVTTPPIFIGCSIHQMGLIQCCEKIDEVDWILCEQCNKWYHLGCINQVDAAEKYVNTSYICDPCIGWKKIITNQKDLIMDQYPKMQVYDYVYMSLIFERRKYITTNKQQQLIFSIPFYPSMVYANQIYKKNQLQPKLCKLIDFKKIKKQLTNNELQDVMSLIQQKQYFDIIDYILNFNLNQEYVIQQNQKSLLSIVNLFEQFNCKIISLRQVRDIINSLKNTIRQDSINLQTLQMQILDIIKMCQQATNNKNSMLQIIKKIITLLNQNLPFKKICSQISQKMNLISIQCFCFYQLANDALDELTLRNYISQYQRLFYTDWSNRNQKSNFQEKTLFQIILLKYYQSSWKVQMRVKQTIIIIQNTKNFTIPKLVHNEPQQYLLFSLNINNSSTFKQIQNKNLRKISQIIPVCYDRQNQYKKCISTQQKIKILLQMVKKMQINFTGYQIMRKIKKKNGNGDHNKIIQQITSSFILTYQYIQILFGKLKIQNFKDQTNILTGFNLLQISEKNLSIFLNFFDLLKKINIKNSYLPKKLVLSLTNKAIKILDIYQKRFNNIFSSYEQCQMVLNLAKVFQIKSQKIISIYKIIRRQAAKLYNLNLNFNNTKIIEDWKQIIIKQQQFFRQNKLQFMIQKLNTVKLWLQIYKKCLNEIGDYYLSNQNIQIKQYQSYQTNSKKKVFFKTVEIIHYLMVKSQFPDCNIKKTLQQLFQRGSKYQNHINQYFETSNRMDDVNIISMIQKIKLKNYEPFLLKIQNDCFNFKVQLMTIKQQIANFKILENQVNQILQSEDYENGLKILPILLTSVFQYQKIEKLKIFLKIKQKQLAHSKKQKNQKKGKNRKNNKQNAISYQSDQQADYYLLKEATQGIFLIQQNRHKIKLNQAVKLRKTISGLPNYLQQKALLHQKISQYIDNYQQVLMVTKKITQKYKEELLFTEQDIIKLRQFQQKYNTQYLRDDDLQVIFTQLNQYEMVTEPLIQKDKNLIKKLKIINHYIAPSFQTKKLIQMKWIIKKQLQSYIGDKYC